MTRFALAILALFAATGSHAVGTPELTEPLEVHVAQRIELEPAAVTVEIDGAPLLEAWAPLDAAPSETGLGARLRAESEDFLAGR